MAMRRVLILVLAGLLVQGAALAGASDDAIGQRITINAGDLPEPMATPSVSNAPARVPLPADGTLTLPPGFKANIFAEDLDHPRNLMVAPNGDVFLAESSAGRITLLRDTHDTGKADFKATYLEGLSRPFGMALNDNVFYVSDTRAVWRADYNPSDQKGGALKPLTRPGALGGSAGHWTRTLALAPDGKALFIAIGSESNIAEEPEPHATIQRLALADNAMTTFASGLRNPTGIAFEPGTDELFVVVNERDGLGDELVPDYLTRVEHGQFYGWPYAYIGRHPDPTMAGKRADLIAKTVTPLLLFRTHSAPLSLVFSTGTKFPERFRNGAFVSHRGSWNAANPRGYKIVFVPFEGDHPAGYYENFATGFRVGGDERAEVIGRPAGMAFAKDGSLLIADDTGRRVWRVAYVGG
jgi:glucose/arabinose dehydrogenase